MNRQSWNTHTYMNDVRILPHTRYWEIKTANCPQTLQTKQWYRRSISEYQLTLPPRQRRLICRTSFQTFGTRGLLYYQSTNRVLSMFWLGTSSQKELKRQSKKSNRKFKTLLPESPSKQQRLIFQPPRSAELASGGVSDSPGGEPVAVPQPVPVDELPKLLHSQQVITRSRTKRRRSNTDQSEIDGSKQPKYSGP